MARAILINGREKTMLVFFPTLEVKVVWRQLLENTAQKRRNEKYEARQTQTHSDTYTDTDTDTEPQNTQQVDCAFGLCDSSRPVLKVSNQSPAARNAQPNYGLLAQVPVDSWFPKDKRGES